MLINFIISYWWLLLLAVILLLSFYGKTTALNQLRTVLRVITFVIIIGFIFWHFVIAKGFEQATACFIEGSKISPAFEQQLAQLPPGEERNQLICTDSQRVYQELVTCLDQTAQEHPLSFKLYAAQPKFTATLNESVASHNAACPTSQLVYPTFE